MPNAGATRSLTRAVLTACLGYVLALQLIVAGMAGGAQAQSLEALANPHALCAGAAGEGPERSGSTPAAPHSHDSCCTLACGVALPAPRIFSPVAYPIVAIAVVHATADFAARPATAPPGLGQGPRAPPSDLA